MVAILSGDGEPTPDVVRLPQLLRLALPNTLHARNSSVSYPVHILMSLF